MSKIWLLVLALLLPAGLGLPTAAHADQTMESGIDRPGNDFRRIELEPSIAGSSICQGMCTNDGSCNAWTFVQSGVQGPKAVCYLKRGIPDAVANNCCTSGVVPRAFEPGIDRPGMDLIRHQTSGQLAPETVKRNCAILCSQNPQCRAWTHVDAGVQGPTSFCYLKSGIPDAVPNGCCTSGVR